jgi:hypothetical protein
MKKIKKFKTGEDLNNSIVNKALSNPDFKKKLIDNPKETINDHAEGEYFLSSDIKVEIHDQSNPNEINLMIPPPVDINDTELTPDELEMVAGGGSSWTWTLVTGLICAGYQTAKHLDNCSCS